MFARRFLQVLTGIDGVDAVHLVVSEPARRVMREETELLLPTEEPFPLAAFLGEGGDAAKVVVHDERAVEAPISSGSFPVRGMVVMPCSMSTVSVVARGGGHNLLHRAAEVQLKERRPLLLCFRESPLSTVHLENLTLASRAGAIPMPIMPPYYLKPKTVGELVDGYCARVLQTMGLDHPGGDRFRWTKEGVS